MVYGCFKGAFKGSPTEITHNSAGASTACRRQVEKSPLAQIEMSLSTVLVGEFWADDGDCDEPDGDRPDERVAGSGCEQDQDDRSRVADEAWSASGVPAGQGLRPAGPRSVGFPEARPAEQSCLPSVHTRSAVALPMGA